MNDESLTDAPDSGQGPLRHFRVGRRAVLTSLASGVGAAMFAARAPAQHAHHVAAATAESATAAASDASLQFLDQHAFDTLAMLSEQIVPGSRAVQVPEFLDKLFAVESIETQRRVMQALGAFEGAARAAYGVSWKALSAEQATALLTKISALPDGDPTREAFVSLKWAVAETYYRTEAGMKELGWDGSRTFAPPSVC